MEKAITYTIIGLSAGYAVLILMGVAADGYADMLTAFNVSE